MRPDDARRAVDAGASSVAVSNHGGNNLDGTPASIRALPAVVAAVGDQAEVLFDGGIRRGGDVVKAGVRGPGRHDRPGVVVGLAAGGETGVKKVLDILGRAPTRRCSAWDGPPWVSWWRPTSWCRLASRCRPSDMAACDPRGTAPGPI
ncbi:MAG TPA: alpha-hydroxy-acid oxidizing protein [Acidimicrobiales bacterium]